MTIEEKEKMRELAGEFVDCVMEKLQDYEIIENGFDDDGNEIVLKTYDIGAAGVGQIMRKNYRKWML